MATRRKTVHELKLAGTFRKDRHAGREQTEVAFPPGVPEKPTDLKDDESAQWDAIVAALSEAGILSAVDGVTIRRAVTYWHLEQSLLRKLANDPADRETAMLATKFGRVWAETASSLGLTPLARSRLRLPSKPDGPQLRVVTRQR